MSERVEILSSRTPIEFAFRLSKMLGCNLFFRRADLLTSESGRFTLDS